MVSAEWWSQPMRPEGDNTGSGIKNQLGRPRLGEYAVLVREAVQNSWDARRPEENVRATFTLQRLGTRLNAWRRLVGGGDLPGLEGDRLRNLDENSVILIISDRGTVGLGGPLRSDQPHALGENANFIQFIRNVGESRDTELGGGTYGFGKGIYYRISEASAILVDSHNNEENFRSRRLMGAALSDAFTGGDGRRYTGRHWWGIVEGGVPDPLLGDHAAKVAESLGLPGFDNGETGTDVVVLLPDISLEREEETLLSLGERIRGHIYWNLWPKFVTSQRPRGIEFKVVVDGMSLDMPEIWEVPILNSFSNSLDSIASRKGLDFTLKKYLPNILGEFSTEYVVQSIARSSSDAGSSVFEYSPIDCPFSHIARMRQAELVVDYFVGPQFPTPEVGYVGTFRASSFADQHFADSEPPTHDDWCTAGLTGSSLGIVRGARTFVSDSCQSLVNARTGVRSKMVQGLGRLSNELGTFLESGLGSRADAPDGTRRRGGDGGGRSHASVRVLGGTKVVVVGQTPVVERQIEIGGSGTRERIKCSAFVVLANGRREDPANSPVGVTTTKFLGWFRQGESVPVGLSQRLETSEISEGRYSARFEHLADAALKIVIERS